MEAFKYNFSQPGACSAAVNYYRHLFRNPPRPRHNEKIEKPVLVIWVCTMKRLSSMYAQFADSRGSGGMLPRKLKNECSEIEWGILGAFQGHSHAILHGQLML